MRGVAHDSIEIDECVEMRGGTNPLIHHLAVGFAQRPWVVVIRTYVRSYRDAKDAQAVGMRAFDKLLIRRENTYHQCRMPGWRHFAIPGEPAQVVHAFKNNEPPNPGGR